MGGIELASEETPPFVLKSSFCFIYYRAMEADSADIIHIWVVLLKRSFYTMSAFFSNMEKKKREANLFLMYVYEIHPRHHKGKKDKDKNLK